MSAAAPLGGDCHRRFAAVGDAFAEHFAVRGGTGAACCVMVGGRTVVDLWGGWSDAGRRAPWTPDTLVAVFSVGKGFAATVLARLAGQRRFDPEAPVAAAWPGFAAAGKGAVTGRQLLSHQAGLPALRRAQPVDRIYDQGAMAAALAAETPWWEPGTAHGYHVNTFGYLAAEVVRRATGTTLGRLLAAEVAGPLGADVHVGLGGADLGRVAEFHWAAGPALPDPGRPATMAELAYTNPPTLSGFGVVNDERWRRAEMPSTNAHASARGVARLYQALAAGGALDGVEVVAPGALAQATRPAAEGPDLVLGRPSRFGLGFQLTQPERPLGDGPRAFGHFGAGGSLGYADPDAGLAFGFVTNTMGVRWQHPSTRALVDAVTGSLAEPRT